MEAKTLLVAPVALMFSVSAAAVPPVEDHHATLRMTTVSGGERAGADAKVVRVIIEDADCDESGPLHIVYSDGAEVLESLPREKPPEPDFGSLEGLADAQVAADKETVGWTEKYSSCCQSYPIPLVLTVYRSGKIILRLQERMVWGWMFVDGGKQVAVEWGPTHGSDVGDFRLYEVDTGRIVGEASGDEELSKLKRDAPAWARELEKRIDSGANLNLPCRKEPLKMREGFPGAAEH